MASWLKNSYPSHFNYVEICPPLYTHNEKSDKESLLECAPA